MAGDAQRGGVRDALARAFAAMERREWGDQAFDEAYFRERLADPAAVVVVLRTAAGRVAGFQIAVADGDSLYVEDTLIAKPHRGKGYVAMLARALEREARRRGYRFVTRDAAIANGYADAIERAYGNRIVERYDHPSEYGPQRYFRIALARSAIDARRPPRP